MTSSAAGDSMQFAIRIHDRWHIAFKDKGARFDLKEPKWDIWIEQKTESFLGYVGNGEVVVPLETLPSEGARGNREGEIVLRVPERHIPLMRKTFIDMQWKLGMYGYGELANSLKPYAELFRGDFERTRYFDDGAVAMAMFGITAGHPAKAITEPGRDDRLIVTVALTFPDGTIKQMTVADNATPDAAAWFEEHLADLAERLAPKQEDLT